VGIEERKAGHSFGIDVQPNRFVLPEERALLDQLDAVLGKTRVSIPAGDYRAAINELATLRKPVDEFFEKVTVNDSRPELRINRLRLLSRIRVTVDAVADFSQIEG
jgi:glycyl-tRNA synthetase beta chain